MFAFARIASPIVVLAWLAVRPAGVAAQTEGFCCRAPEPPHLLTLCSPLATTLADTIVPEGLGIIFPVPPRETSSLLSPLLAGECDSLLGCPWGVAQDDTVPATDVWVSGTFLGVYDQRIEVAVLKIGDNFDSGVVGTDRIELAWGSVFFAGIGGDIVLDANNAGTPIPFVITPPGAPPDTSLVPGVRITFRRGSEVKRGWRVVFDVEDFEGFHVWRWGSNPATEPRVVGTYNKMFDRDRPGESWFSNTNTPTGTVFAFLDRFVIDGNVYHYAVTTFDQGFDRVRGGSLGSVPFDSPLPDSSCASQLRVDFLRPPPAEFQPVQAVPNPYRQVDCEAIVDPLSTCTVRFIRMPSRGTLLIFTLAGDLVREYRHPEDASAEDSPGTLRWDTRNAAGQEVASGVYIFKIVDLNSGQESFGRLAIIR